jgi:hypothetical protein
MIDGLVLQERYRLALLICLHIVACCVSLVCVTGYGNMFSFAPPKFHLFFDTDRLPIAVATVAAFAIVSIAFVLAPFSFGYFTGFYFYTMILGYLWLNTFSDFELRSPARGSFSGSFHVRVPAARSLCIIAF